MDESERGRHGLEPGSEQRSVVEQAAAWVNVLRSEIVSGALPPEGRMSTHLQLVDRFGVSALTVQHALNDLIRDGFLYSIPRKGTYVVPNPVVEAWPPSVSASAALNAKPTAATRCRGVSSSPWIVTLR
ncbi:MAG: winged helix-turn-helix transcriptional regulator [Planctomycetes bacterium]|nr:winged helix-turn-helix transcriptional regulator [Planctomycetota bacterium]